jgi:hypothetical protein
MAEQNLDIVVRVRGGQVASSEIKGVGTAMESTGTKAETSTKGLGKSLEGLNVHALGIMSTAAAYKGFAYIQDAVKATAGLAKSTAGLSRLTGLDSQSSAGWIALAKERGVQGKQLNQGFITLNKNIAAGASGSKSSAKSFKAMGLDATALKAASANERMAMLADAFHKMPPGIDKATAAQKLFGRQSQNMLPILDQGGKAVNEHVKALGKQMGMTKEGAKASMEFVKKQREWQATQEQLKISIGSALMPVLVQLAEIITPLVKAFTNAMASSGAFRLIVIALTAALVTFVAVLIVASASIAWIPALVVGVGLALVMLYQKVGWFKTGVDAMAKAAVAAFKWIKDAVMVVFNWVKQNWPLLVAILGGPIAAAAAQIIKHWDDIKGAASSVLGFFKQVAGYISGAFAGAWNTAAGAVKGVTSAIQSVIDTAKKVTSLPGKAANALMGMLPGHQMGGTVMQAGSVLVGEAGPEVVHLPSGSQVVPNHALRAASGGGGGGRVVVPVYLDRRQIALAFGDYTADQQAAR